MESWRPPPSHRTWRPFLPRRRTDVVVRRAPLLRLAFAPTLLLFGFTSAAQETSSAAPGNTVTPATKAPDAPTAALRDALSAACSQSEQSFSKFLPSPKRDNLCPLY